jgi:hypothetical protein
VFSRRGLSRGGDPTGGLGQCGSPVQLEERPEAERVKRVGRDHRVEEGAVVGKQVQFAPQITEALPTDRFA